MTPCPAQAFDLSRHSSEGLFHHQNTAGDAKVPTCNAQRSVRVHGPEIPFKIKLHLRNVQHFFKNLSCIKSVLCPQERTNQCVIINA